mmetsp:Transcript_29695/g.78794  ORF Transcript_29695/g.78794 Transcript_29695/m.78794 type:complete len:254 (-) Transcript_29695:1439-2200(-)
MDLRAEPRGDLRSDARRSPVERVPAVAENHSPEVVPVPDDSAQCLVHGPRGLVLVPLSAVATTPILVEEVLLQQHFQIVLGWIRDANHDDQATLLISKIDTLAQLAPTHGCQDRSTNESASRWTSGDSVAVLIHHAQHVMVAFGFLENLLGLLDFIPEPHLTPSLQHRLLLSVGLEGQQHPVGHARGKVSHGAPEILEVRGLVAHCVRGVQRNVRWPYGQHIAPDLLLRVDDMRVLHYHRKGDAERLDLALDG